MVAGICYGCQSLLWLPMVLMVADDKMAADGCMVGDWCSYLLLLSQVTIDGDLTCL